MQVLSAVILCFLFILSCGVEKNKEDFTDEVIIDSSRLDEVFNEKDTSKQKLNKKAKVETDTDTEKKKVLYPSIEEVKEFPKLEVNASYKSSYKMPLDIMIERFWDVGNTCENCKYNMPSIVKAKEFVLSDIEKIVWHAIEKKLWLFSFKSSTFLSVKQYRSEDGKEFVLDLVTLDNETAKDLERRSGLKFKATFKKLMYRFKLQVKDDGVEANFLAAGITGGLSSRVPQNILEKELKSSLKDFHKAFR